MVPEFLEKLQWARTLSDCPYGLSSACRCKDHNRDVGGLDNSSHLNGLAVDIKTPNARIRFQVLYGLIKAGFTRIGIYKSFIHVDGDESKPQKVCWFDHEDVEIANQQLGE
jgi:hypothetical protein